MARGGCSTVKSAGHGRSVPAEASAALYGSRVAVEENDPKHNPEYLTLSAAAKEAGVRVQVLQMLIQDRKITAGIARTRNGHAYLHRDHLPTWSQIEHTLASMYVERLTLTDAALRAVETEVEALRNDLTEAQEHPDGPLGDDLLEVTKNPYDRTVSTRTMSGALAKFRDAVIDLGDARRHLDDVRRTV